MQLIMECSTGPVNILMVTSHQYQVQSYDNVNRDSELQIFTLADIKSLMITLMPTMILISH